MLTRLLRHAAMAAAAALALVFLAQVPALAGGGPGGPFGHAQCGQSYSAQCVVTAGTPGGAGPTAPAAPGTGHAGSAPAAGGGGVPRQLLNAMVGPGGALPEPGTLARLVVRYLRLPDPVIESSPAPGALQLVRLPVWLWVAPAAWQPRSQTAQVPGESVTATATPVLAAWSMGDGSTVTCHGPGTPYGGGSPAAASPTCGYTYQESSAGQPGGAFRVTVTVTWDITWKATGGAGGVLAPLQTVAAAEFRVAESQALNTSGG